MLIHGSNLEELARNKEDQLKKRSVSEKLHKVKIVSESKCSISKCQRKHLDAFSGLEELYEKYDSIQGIEIEKKSICPTLIPTEKIEVSPHSSKVNFIIAQLKKRIKEYPIIKRVCLSSKRLAFQTQTEEKVGPGSYKVEASTEAETHEFSHLPRLYTPITHNINIIQSLFPVKSPQNSFIQRNKESLTTMKSSKEQRTNKIKSQRIYETIVKNQKKCLDAITNQERVAKVDRKRKLFEWRLQKDELAKVKIFLIKTIICIGFNTVIRYRGKIKKSLKSKWEVLLRKFVIVLKAFGKFLKILTIIRRRLVNQRIKSLSFGLTEFMKNDIQRKKLIIRDTLLSYNSLPILYSLTMKYKFNILKIQRAIRNYLKIQALRRKSLKILWEKKLPYVIENDYFLRSQNTEYFGLISAEIRESFIKKYVRNTINDYVNDKETFKRSLTESPDIEKQSLQRFTNAAFKLFSASSKFSAVIIASIKFKNNLENIRRRKKFINPLK